MSIEAINWALNLAPVPPEAKSGKPSSACAFVLIALATHAGSDGTNSFPSVSTLMRYTRLSERTIRTCLDRLHEFGVIRPSDPTIVAAYIRRADRRPQGWDLGLARIRTDFTDDELAALERTIPGIRTRVALERGAAVAPRDTERGATDARTAPNGVQLTQPRGATVAPEPYIEPSLKEQPKNLSPSGDGVLFGEPAPAVKPDPLAGFDEFWRVYPKHVGKGDARKAWPKAVSKVGVAVLVRRAQAYAGFMEDEDQTFVPYPATWLNGERWCDDLDEAEQVRRDRDRVREHDPI